MSLVEVQRETIPDFRLWDSDLNLLRTWFVPRPTVRVMAN